MSSPFAEMIQWMTIFSFDFLTIECVIQNSNFEVSVLCWSIVPIVITALNGLAFFLRRRKQNEDISPKSRDQLVQEHTLFFLFLTYLGLPPVSRRLLQALDCVQVNSHFA